MKLCELFDLPLLYHEAPDSSFTHDGRLYSINKLLSYSQNLPVRRDFPLSTLSWLATDVKASDVTRAKTVDLSVPIIVTPWTGSEYVMLDGFHRVVKALSEGLTTLPARVVFEDTLALCTEDER